MADFASEPIEVITLACWRDGQWTRDVTDVHVDPACVNGAAPVLATWWGTLADLDCVTCRVLAHCQILRRREGRLA